MTRNNGRASGIDRLRGAVSTWARQFTRASISLPQARYEPLRRAFGRWQNADCGPRSPKIYVCRRGRCSSRLRSDELNLRETYIHTGKTSDTILAKQEQLAPSCARC
ncbi:hypothetical protein OH76DRAFT_1409929 [Lentinus brumalis]|uniref:Uncharacterized protein n=1 Tax=Lentinus brumalis TaxID=2498619 RepID=A0A371CTT5_9APHY|nr:hypothetical protein OH76DRAFT_1409929 [Polyporus brumalis]